MLESLVGLLMQAEVMKTQISVQETVDSYYVAEAGNASGHVIEIKYDVDSLGTVKGDLNEFKNVVAATLDDARGWGRAEIYGSGRGCANACIFGGGIGSRES